MRFPAFLCLVSVLASLLVPSTTGFFPRKKVLLNGSQLPLSSLKLSTFCNTTDRTYPRNNEVCIHETQDALSEKSSMSPQTKDDQRRSVSGLRKLFQMIGKVLYSVKASCAVMAIHMVLTMRLENPVLRSLPPEILIFLLEVSLHRPRVLHSIAAELADRIHKEIMAFTDKDSYQVGDISKAILSRYTRKSDYQFGDLTRATVSRYTQKEVYEFGDVVRATLEKAKAIGGDRKKYKESKEVDAMIARMAGGKDYEFGDATKAVLRRMKARDI